MVAAARALVPLVEGSAPSTTKRRSRTRELWDAAPELQPLAPERFFAALLQQMFAPTTAVTYGLTASSHIKTLQHNTEWDNALRWLRKECAKRSHERKAATPALPSDLHRLTSRAEFPTLFTLMVSASRRADLDAAQVTHIWPVGKRHLAVRVAFPQMKSDLFGQRSLAKILEVSPRQADLICDATTQPAPYRKCLQAMHTVDKTVHSLRRGAVSFLAGKVAAEDIASFSRCTRWPRRPQPSASTRTPIPTRRRRSSSAA